MLSLVVWAKKFLICVINKFIGTEEKRGTARTLTERCSTEVIKKKLIEWKQTERLAVNSLTSRVCFQLDCCCPIFVF